MFSKNALRENPLQHHAKTVTEPAPGPIHQMEMQMHNHQRKYVLFKFKVHINDYIDLPVSLCLCAIKNSHIGSDTTLLKNTSSA